MLIRASALSPQCAEQGGQPSMKPLSLAMAGSRAGLKDTNKWQRGIATDCWTDYHCSKRLMGCFLRASSFCELGYSCGITAVMFLTATIQLQASAWDPIVLGWVLGSASHQACHPRAFLVISRHHGCPAPGDTDVETAG